jgi:hypothetical protein
MILFDYGFVPLWFFSMISWWFCSVMVFSIMILFSDDFVLLWFCSVMILFYYGFVPLWFFSMISWWFWSVMFFFHEGSISWWFCSIMIFFREGLISDCFVPWYIYIYDYIWNEYLQEYNVQKHQSFFLSVLTPMVTFDILKFCYILMTFLQ